MLNKLVPARKAWIFASALVVAVLCIATAFYAMTAAQRSGVVPNTPNKKTLAVPVIPSLKPQANKNRSSRDLSQDSSQELSQDSSRFSHQNLIQGASQNQIAETVRLPLRGLRSVNSQIAMPGAGLPPGSDHTSPAGPAVPNATFRLDPTIMLTDGSTLQPVGFDTFGRMGNVLYADLHKIAKSFGYSVKFYKESGFYAVYRKDEDASVFVVNSSFAHIHGEDVTTEGALVVHKDKVYAPFSALLKLENLSFHSLDNGDIAMSKEDYGRLAKAFSLYQTNPIELKDFARLLFFEARDGTIIKKMAVAGVVMNRVYSSRFESTIHDVMFAHNQFPPAYYASFSTMEPDPIYFEAARRVLNGENTVPNVFYFNLAPFPGKEADFYKNIEGDYFYY